MVTDLAERRNPKFKAVSGVPTRNHVFFTTEPQKVSGIVGNRYPLEVTGAGTDELVV